MNKNFIQLKGLSYVLECVKDDRYRIYHNKERNITILAIAYCKDESIDLVFNGITEEPYNKLIEFMNKNNNLIIKWVKVEGITSDYTIYCDCNYTDDWNIIDLEQYLHRLIYGAATPYKYNIVKDGYINQF